MITDLVFVPEAQSEEPVVRERPRTAVVMMDYFMHLEYREVVCPIVRRYADALMEGKILGQISPTVRARVRAAAQLLPGELRVARRGPPRRARTTAVSSPTSPS